MFSNEELEGILAPLRDAMASEGFQFASPFDFFTARVKRNLRIVLSMDPTNPLYRQRCEANPAFFTRCVIVWADNWSRVALEGLPASRLKASGITCLRTSGFYFAFYLYLGMSIECRT